MWSSDGFQDPVRGGAVRPRKEQSPEPHSDWPVAVAGVLPQPDWSNLGEFPSHASLHARLTGKVEVK